MMPEEYLVVFTDKTDLPWLHFLRRGFRHCFILIRFGDIWVSTDGLFHHTEILRLDIPDIIDVARWFNDNGDTVIRLNPPSRATPKIGRMPFFYTCVEHAKRVVGHRNFCAVTPYQFYKSLIKQQKG